MIYEDPSCFFFGKTAMIGAASHFVYPFCLLSYVKLIPQETKAG